MTFRRVILFSCCLAAPLLLFCSGCTRNSASAESPDAPTPWSWADYPPVTRMRLGLLSARVLPKTSYSISATLSGPLQLYVSQAQTNLSAGFLWAEFQPKILSAEVNALEEARSRLAEKEHLFYQLDMPRQKLRMQKEIQDARRQIALLEIFAKHTDLAPDAAKATGSPENSLKPETLENARKDLQLLEENYRYLCETNPAVFGADIQAQRTELQQRELDLERRQTQGRFRMPFNGQLNVSIPLVHGVSEYPVNAGQELAVVRDVSALLLRVPLAEPAWSSLAPENLTASISFPDGSRWTAAFAYKRLEKFQFREDIVYYFQFPPEASAVASRLVGAEMTAELWLGLSQAARVVPKLTLVMRQPAAFQNRRWDEGLAQISPGSRVLVEGQTDLAIIAP